MLNIILVFFGILLCAALGIRWLFGDRLSAYIAVLPCLVVSFLYIGNNPSFCGWITSRFGIGTLITDVLIFGSIFALGVGLAFFPRMMWACKRVGDRVNAHDEALYARNAKLRAEKRAARAAAKNRPKVEPTLHGGRAVITIDH